MEIKLNGASAILAVVALLGFGAYRVMAMQTELETEALDELAMFLAAEYAGSEVDALAAKLDAATPISDEEAKARADAILASQKITFASVEARGMWNGREGDDVIVKVEIQVDGGPPPDGDSIRYYRMRYRGLAGWRVGGRTSVWSYRLKLF